MKKNFNTTTLGSTLSNYGEAIKSNTEEIVCLKDQLEKVTATLQIIQDQNHNLYL